VCGDGMVQGYELCDGDCPTTCDDGDPCTVEEEYGDPYYCYAACFRFPVGCVDGDGCCSEFATLTGICTNLNDTDCPAPPGDLGSPCAADEQCTDVGVDDPNPDGVRCLPPNQEDAELLGSAFAGGYCTRLDCAFNGCPEGGTCVCPSGGGPDSSCAPGDGGITVSLDVGFGLTGVCLESCESDDDCRGEGYRCYDVNGDATKECYLYGTGEASFGEECNGIWDCAGGETARCSVPLNLGFSTEVADQAICTRLCDPNGDALEECPDQYTCYVNSCQPSPDAENVGGPCDQDIDCGGPGINGNRCLQEIAGYNDGMCTTGYSEEQCPAGTRFVSFGGGLSSARPGFNGCAVICASDSDCRSDPGYRCLDPEDGEGSVCLAVWEGDGTTGESCEGNWDCDGPAGFICAADECTRACGPGFPECPSGTNCFGSTCQADCEDNSDCPDGGFCIDLGPNVGSICV